MNVDRECRNGGKNSLFSDEIFCYRSLIPLKIHETLQEELKDSSSSLHTNFKWTEEVKRIKENPPKWTTKKCYNNRNCTKTSLYNPCGWTIDGCGLAKTAGITIYWV